MNRTPNLDPATSRREAYSLLGIFAILYCVVASVFAGGKAMIDSTTTWVHYSGYGVAIIAILFGVLVTAVLVFSFYDWQQDRKGHRRRGMPQTTGTSGVPFMPGVTKQVQ